ncbi:MAG: type II toxin-antitoxin system PemK/MazF family toxin [Betaproteobacteria bacterium]|nr:type II toxin-antitoxin system PemK/MazF family toxin [Betaproteobacteria bacterium]MDH4323943.1 type II toxin-antitoxin system PemK/MazF family toxin [Betaproteobacteria bacterium]MDH5211405.1 type II toxin-antitoxin system PemK/MazF family toxin [Betaproteobacteria bacterium]MDH5579225.1 type II toxin-antitoxin system PemK/MazF family toxin [Betaproteobacteria bacterium]
MPSTIGFSFGDLVLVPFPFTDQSAVKRRPAVVISAQRYNGERTDLIIMAVTSQTRATGSFGEVQVIDWKEAGLLKPSAVKPVVTTIENRLVLRRLGRLKDSDQASLRRVLATILG